jgi:response regulator of citrate/malate metabolism
MNGIEAIKRIRMIPGERGRVTIVGMTASVPDRQIVEGLRAGMTAYLVKPFTGGELLTLLDRVARRRPVALLGSQGTFEPDTLAQLASCMSFSEMEGQLLGLARTLEALVDALEGSATHTAPIAALVHEVAVTAVTGLPRSRLRRTSSMRRSRQGRQRPGLWRPRCRRPRVRPWTSCMNWFQRSQLVRRDTSDWFPRR